MKSVVFDIEANGLEDADTIWCMAASPDDSDEILDWVDIQQGCAYLEENEEIIGHNIVGYDLPLIKKLKGWEPNPNVKITDTMVMSRLFNPDRRRPVGYTGKGGPHSLECWGYRVCRAKPDHEEWSVFSPAMLRRCREDVGINKLTSHLLSSEASGHDWTEALELEHSVLRIITQQANNGVYFDVSGATELISQLDQRIQHIDDELIPKLPTYYKPRGVTVNKPFLNSGGYSQMVLSWFPILESSSDRFVGGPFTRLDEHKLDIGSISQLKQYFLDHGWKPTEWNFSKKTGHITSPKLTEDSYDTIVGGMAPQIKDRMLCSHRRSQIQGWLDRVRPDNRLSASANTCGTPTGRMRHSNVVNVPKASDRVPYGKEMRALFTVPEGSRLVGCDAEQLELRLLAHFMDDDKYVEEILHGDIHSHNQNLAGLPTRDDAKTFIYAFIYGAGDGKLGSIVGGSEKDGARLRRSFLQGLPKLGNLIRRVKGSAGKGWLKGLDGRKLWLRQNDNGEVMNHKALNLLIQGAGAVVMKKAMVIMEESSIKNNLKAFKVLDMHDETQWEAPLEESELVAELLQSSIVQAGVHFKLRCPMAAKAIIGLNWSETH